jgi:F0F1-type ATP synthase delta subunit
MQVRRLYEMYPDAPLKQVAALQLKLTDPLFAARLSDDMRVQLEKIARERAVRDVIAPLEVPHVEDRMAEAREYTQNPSPIDENNCHRHLRDIEAERRSYDVEVPELEAIADQILERRLWGGDTSRVRSALLDFAKGSGSLSALQSAIDESITAVADSTELDDEGVLQLMIRYHNAKFVDVVSWDLQSIMHSANLKNPESIDAAKTAIRTRLAAYNIDPLVVSLLCTLARDGDGGRLDSVVEGYKTIMKNFRGEVDALLMSAEELDSATFEAIRHALESANPGKTITLETQIEPGLGAGFVIKAGVQRFDFSLAAHIDESRKALSL